MAESETLVFIPAWNEEENLPAVLDELAQGMPGADVVVIDDGSTDDTAAVARAHGADVVSFGENRGLRVGIAAGYAYADEHGYEFVGRVDADGQHPVAELARLLEIVRAGEADVAVGSRFATGDGYEAYRYVPSRSRRVGTSALRHARCAPRSAGRSSTRRAGCTRRTGARSRTRPPLLRAARQRSSRCSASATRDSSWPRSRFTCASARAASRSSAGARPSVSC